jgi:hypothetical protein
VHPEKTAMNESVSPLERGDCALPSRDGKESDRNQG